MKPKELVLISPLWFIVVVGMAASLTKDTWAYIPLLILSIIGGACFGVIIAGTVLHDEDSDG